MRSVAAVVALVICVHAGLWALLQRQHAVANIDAPLASISYSPYARSQHPDYGDRPTPEQIRADLKILSPYTQAIRTYSATGGVELVPPIAAQLGLKVTLGIWIDKNEARNEREIQSAIALARRYSNINAIVVGNESTLRADKTVDELIHAFKAAWASRDVAAVVLTGAGDKAFCAGGDVKERAETGGYGETEWGTFEIERLHRIIRDIPKPVIAAVNGVAYTGAFRRGQSQPSAPM